MSKKDLTKADRIKKEQNRLKRICKNIDEKKRKVADGLIYRAAFMRIQLEDYEADLNENGYTEMFTQSEKTEPYERERPVARLYNSINKNYQSIIQQLTKLLPEGKPKSNENKDIEEFGKFMNRR